jgi:hypothetical protein
VLAVFKSSTGGDQSLATPGLHLGGEQHVSALSCRSTGSRMSFDDGVNVDSCMA